MISQVSRRARERGIVLVAALLLLVVMSILAMAMFRTNGVQELIAGNIREKQRALQTAEDAETYAEMFMSNMGNIQTPALYVSCTSMGLVAYTTTTVPQFCIQTLSSLNVTPTAVPWKYNNNEIGSIFYPGAIGGGTTATGDLLVAAGAPGANTYQQPPRFYVAYLGVVQNQAFYQVDAWNYGSTTNTAAEVEAIYVVTCTSACLAPTI